MKRRQPFLTLIFSFFLFQGCLDSVAGLSSADIRAALDAASEEAAALGGSAILIDNFSEDLEVTVSEAASSIVGAGIYLPKGSLDGADADNPVIVRLAPTALTTTSLVPANESLVQLGGPAFTVTIEFVTGGEVGLLLPVTILAPFTEGSRFEDIQIAQFDDGVFTFLADQEAEFPIVSGTADTLGAFAAVYPVEASTD